MHGMTKSYLDFVPALKDLEPLMDTMVDEGLWEQVQRKVIPKCLGCLLYTSPSPRDRQKTRMPSSA